MSQDVNPIMIAQQQKLVETECVSIHVSKETHVLELRNALLKITELFVHVLSILLEIRS